MKTTKLVIDNEKLIHEWHWEKNNSLNIFPDKLTSGSDKNVWWKSHICGHIWANAIYNRSNRQRCPSCVKIKKTKK